MANRHGQVEADPARAFRALRPRLSKAARRKNPAQAEETLAALARHGDALPVEWRELLVELADEEPLATSAAVGLAQVRPHRSMVGPMIRRLTKRLDACAAAPEAGRSWDDEIGLAVLAKCADRRAAGVLARLLGAPRVAHWDLLLAACLKCGAPELIPPLARWLAAAKKQGVSPKWDGFAEGNLVLRALKARQRASSRTSPGSSRSRRPRRRTAR